MPTHITCVPTIKETTSIGVPSSPSRGDRHNEIDANNDLVMEWFWNGNNWLSRSLVVRDLLLISGQNITLTNIIVGLVSANSDDIPFPINSIYGIYVTKIYAGFKVPTGNLSNTNFWSLAFKNGSTILQTLDVKSGDDAATTGDIRKSSADINISYSKSGKYSFSFTLTGIPPSVRSPSALIEYKLVR